MSRCATLELANHNDAVDNEIIEREGRSDAAACSAKIEAPSVTMEVIDGHRVHPAASVMPAMPDKQFADLVESIATHGLGEPIEFKDELLVEGRHRLRAVVFLRERGVTVELRTTAWQPLPSETVADYVRRKNVRRRHMTDSQLLQSTAALLLMADEERAAAGYASGRIQPGEIRNPDGSNQYSPAGSAEDGETESTPSSDRRSRNRAKTARSAAGRLAAETGQSIHKARQAIAVQKRGTPEEIKAITSGEKTQPEVLKEIVAREGSPPVEKKPRRIEHPFTPRTDLERDLLTAWIRLCDNKIPVGERKDARRVMREILKAEEAASECMKGGGT